MEFYNYYHTEDDIVFRVYADKLPEAHHKLSGVLDMFCYQTMSEVDVEWNDSLELGEIYPKMGRRFTGYE